MHYDITTLTEHIVYEYSGLDFEKIEELPIDTFLLLLRDAFIHKQNQTESGREYLENCWRIEQTKPDKKALREKFGKEGENNSK